MSLFFLNPHRPRTRTGTVSSAFWLPAAARSVTARGASLETFTDRHEAPKMTRPKCGGFSGAEIATGKFIPEAATFKFLRPNFNRFFSPGLRSAPAVCMIPGHASHPFDCAFPWPAVHDADRERRQNQKHFHVTGSTGSGNTSGTGKVPSRAYRLHRFSRRWSGSLKNTPENPTMLKTTPKNSPGIGRATGQAGTSGGPFQVPADHARTRGADR